MKISIYSNCVSGCIKEFRIIKADAIAGKRVFCPYSGKNNVHIQARIIGIQFPNCFFNFSLSNIIYFHLPMVSLISEIYPHYPFNQ